jgi:hypothetical protein
MADVVQTLALIVLAQNYRGGLVRQANRQAVALKCLPFVEGAGKNVAFAPTGTGAVAENFAEGADVANYGSDAQVSATIPWGMYRANFHVSGLAGATAASSASPEGNLKLWAKNMVDSMSTLASLINGAVYTGAGTGTTLAGLDQAIGSTTNTYATLDRTVGANSYFLPNVFAPVAATALTFDLLRSDLAAIYVASGMRPDIAFVHPNVFRKIAALFDGLKQYQFQVITARGPVNLDGSAGAINFDGCMFVEDKDATDGKIYYVNTGHVRMEYLPMDLATIPGMNDEIMDLFADDGFGTTPLGIRLEMLAKTGDSDKATMKTYLQLVCDRPNSCGVRSNCA